MVDSSISVEELSASLVREYLARKGLKGTLAKLDEELPRSSGSISNRAALAKAVHIEKLMRKNKEDAAPYRTMIEVIVKFLTTSASRKASTISHAATLTKILNPKEGVAAPTAQERGGTYKTPGSDVPIHTEGLSTSNFKKSKVQQDVDLQMAIGERDTLSQHGKPITKSSTSSPLSHEFLSSHPAPSHLSKVPESTPSHFDKAMYPQVQLSPLKESRGSGSTIEPRKHSTSLLQKEKTSVVSVKPRGGMLSPSGGSSGGSVITVASAYMVSSQPTFNTLSSTRGMLKSVDSSMTSREPPTLKPSNKAELAKKKPHQGRHTYKDSTDNKEVTVTQDELTKRLHTTLVTNAVKSGPLFMGVNEVARSHPEVQQDTINDPSSDDLLLCEDLEDIDVGASLFSAPPTLTHVMKPPNSKGQQIDLTTAKALRELVFGSATGPSFNPEWRRQNFQFCDIPKLEYGLVQHKGGPCGVLACVQAYILKHLMFTGSKLEFSSSPQPTHKERTAALVAALTDILWKAGQQTSAMVATTTRTTIGGKVSDRSLFSSTQYKPDNLTEKLTLHTFTNSGRLRDYIESQVPVLQDGSSSGCISFLYSLLLSRGIENIKSDMDADTTILGAHGYCTQELVNLILTGYAVSNTFNGTQELGTSAKEKVILRGTSGPCELGFLSLFEHHGTCVVGSNLKEPEYPVWVVCSESHFTVLFSHQRKLLQDLQLQKRFDLHYYDGLANQDNGILLTIDNSDQSQKQLQQPNSDNDLVPPLELVIKTKWKLAKINWNETEPIL